MLIKLYHIRCHTIINFVILRVRKCLDVAVNIWCQMISLFFWAAVKKRSGNYHYHWLVRAHYSLHSARWYKSRSRAKLAEAASGEGEPRDGVCEIADSPASFESDPWKHFWFHRAKEWENKTGNSMRPNAKLRRILTNGNRIYIL